MSTPNSPGGRKTQSASKSVAQQARAFKWNIMESQLTKCYADKQKGRILKIKYQWQMYQNIWKRLKNDFSCNWKVRETFRTFSALICNTYPTLMSPIHKFREVFHPAFSVRVLEENATHILSTEVHLMGQLQHSLHPDVATNYKGQQLL